MSASKMYITRCLLGAHGLFLCLCFLGMASAQPSADVQVRCTHSLALALRHF